MYFLKSLVSLTRQIASSQLPFCLCDLPRIVLTSLVCGSAPGLPTIRPSSHLPAPSHCCGIELKNKQKTLSQKWNSSFREVGPGSGTPQRPCQLPDWLTTSLPNYPSTSSALSLPYRVRNRAAFSHSPRVRFSSTAASVKGCELHGESTHLVQFLLLGLLLVLGDLDEVVDDDSDGQGQNQHAAHDGRRSDDLPH